jgi:hypothetical protein
MANPAQWIRRRFLLCFAALFILTGSSAAQSVDALDEVNATRTARGLRPFLRDDNLTAGALNVAQFRAARLCAGHTSNDFSGLPAGVTASASGCAAWPASMGWGSCCTYENYRFAGAAWCMGRDGKRYMHLFVRN